MSKAKGKFYGGNTIENYIFKDCTLEGSEIKDSKLIGTAYKVVEVDCTDDVVLATADRDATVIIITDTGVSKSLVLNMQLGQEVIIVNSGSNNVTVKADSESTGVDATAAKLAKFIVTSNDVTKFTSDIDIS